MPVEATAVAMQTAVPPLAQTAINISTRLAWMAILMFTNLNADSSNTTLTTNI
jgi:hypothetical protein